MTKDLVKVENFMGIPVRIIKTDTDEIIIPLIDIAKGVEYDSAGITRLYERNSELLKDYARTVVMTSGDQVAPTKHICVTKDGVIGILMKMDYIRIKSEDKRKRIVAFQKWTVDTIGKIMKGETVTVPKPIDPTQLASSLGNRVADQLQIGDAMARYANVDRGIACSMALSKVEFDTGTDLTMWKNLLVKGKPSKRIGILNATELGRLLGFGDTSGRTVNGILNKLGFINRLGDHWTLTQRGEPYAEAFPVTGIAASGKSYARYDIKWQPEMLEILRKHLFETLPKPEQGLITGYIS